SERQVHYIILKRRRGVGVVEVPRATSMVFQWCDGRHSIRAMCALVESLDDAKTVAYLEALGTRQLVAMILAGLSKIVGLRTRAV
ncbi:hypothetical protein ACFLS5_03805, partial [Candidatus Bipolaricaulota bacterium]